MNNWLPGTGDLFYAKCARKIYTDVEDGYNTKTVVRTDRSYDETIFRMVASDSSVMVADIVYGHTYGDSRRLLLRKDFIAMPVGPAVMAALDLQILPDNE